MKISKSFPLLSATTLVGAWDFSFVTRAVHAAQKTVGLRPPTVRIAVIGAGAGGSSAAYWIGKAKERHGLDVEVDIFEKENYIGGRSTVVHPYDDNTLPALELGASIFVTANKNLYKAISEFNLTLRNLADEDDDFGVWDGREFVVTYTGTLMDKLRMLWRYGLSSPRKTTQILDSLISTILQAYTPRLPFWTSIEAFSQSLGFTTHTSLNAVGFFTSQGVSERWVKEMIEAATRVNYAQDATAIHGLGGAVSMATSGAAQVEGGNFQIFESFVKHSRAQLRLNTTITTIAKEPSPSGKVRWRLGASVPIEQPYDHVILATPYHLADITLEDTPASDSLLQPRVEYVHLHVTLISSTSARPLPQRFGLAPGTTVPRFVLTTAERERNGGLQPEFNSLSLHETYEVEGRTEYIYKIFSLDQVSDFWLEHIFGEGSVGWVHRKEWDAYPKLMPVTSYPPVRADDGLWYVNSMESFISTMETEVLSGRNVVDNLLREAFGPEKGICPPGAPIEAEGKVSKKIEEDERIYGWDC